MSVLNPKTKAPTVTPTKKTKKAAKKVEFVPTSSIKTRSKSKSPPKHEITMLNEEEWPTPKEASPKATRKSPPKNTTTSMARDITPTKENPISIDKRPSKEPNAPKSTSETTATVDRGKSILEQIKPPAKFQTFKKDRTQTYLDASNKAYEKVTKKEVQIWRWNTGHI